MTLSPTIQLTLSRYQPEIQAALRAALANINPEKRSDQDAEGLTSYYGQMRYHLGWVDANLAPISGKTGKLLRPTLLLLAYEAAGAWGQSSDQQEPAAYLRRALPAAAALELTHNFTLIHDDIVDEDTERHHRSTVWKVWGVPQAINAGDGMFALGRQALWGVLAEGVDGAIAVQLGAALDQACLTIAEGQYLDMHFETQISVSVTAYVDMIRRKTAALMACAAEIGARLGTRDQDTIARLTSFGEAIGIAFQVRDDLLGVWASTAELGKTPAGDVYRRKKSLPILHALEHASPEDRQQLHTTYQQATPLTSTQVAEVLAIFARTGTRDYCRAFLAKQCQQAHEALVSVPRQPHSPAERAIHDLETLVHFVEATSLA